MLKTIIFTTQEGGKETQWGMLSLWKIIVGLTLKSTLKGFIGVLYVVLYSTPKNLLC